jgi:outer membrane protein assembly factor BamB
VNATNSVGRAAVRLGLIVIGAIIVGGVLVGALSSHLFLNGPSAAKQTAHAHLPEISKKWEFATSEPITGALALSSDGTVYGASQDGFLYAIDASGKLKWKFDAGPMLSAPVLDANGAVYVTNEEEKIFAIDSNGNQLWVNGGGPYADKEIGSIANAIDSDHLYTLWRAQLRAIRLSDGYFDWPTGYGFQHHGSISQLPDGLTVFTEVGRLKAVDSTGRTQWEYPVMNPPVTVDMITKTNGHIPSGNFWLDSGIAVADDGTIYMCAAGSRLVALTPDGQFKWEFQTKIHFVNHASPVIGVDGTVYFASGDGHLYALNPDGGVRWDQELSGEPISATPILAQDDTIYVATTTAVVAVSTEGRLLAEAAANGGESSPTVAPDGTVYIASRDGKIAALAGTFGGLQNSAWPKFQATLANSGHTQASGPLSKSQ